MADVYTTDTFLFCCVVLFFLFFYNSFLQKWKDCYSSATMTRKDVGVTSGPAALLHLPSELIHLNSLFNECPLWVFSSSAVWELIAPLSLSLRQLIWSGKVTMASLELPPHLFTVSAGHNLNFLWLFLSFKGRCFSTVQEFTWTLKIRGSLERVETSWKRVPEK